MGGKGFLLDSMAGGAGIFHRAGGIFGGFDPAGFYPGMVNGKSRDDLRFDFLTAGAGIADRARCGAGGGDPAGLRPIMSQGGKRICLLGVANGAVIEYRTGSGAGSIRPVDFHPGMVSGQGWDGLRSG